MTSEPDRGVLLLRHTVATVAYRGAKVLRGAPAEFANFKLTPTARTPAEIAAHMGDLFDWALALAQGRHEWHDSSLLPWEEEVARFFRTLAAFDGCLASGLPLGCPAEKLFQGPVADALTHIGQIAIIRRAAGAPIRGENYLKADIAAGRVGAAQPPPRQEFG
jgi:hypothetical protein